MKTNGVRTNLKAVIILLIAGIALSGCPKKPPQPTEESVAEEVSKIGAPAERPTKPIYFDFDQSIVREDQKPILKSLAAWLRENSKGKLTLEGHCDERGTEEYNLALGQRRADSVKSYLVSAGVSPDRLKTISYGEEKPADSGHDEAAWAKNRRVQY
ncbi:MAG: peptidoglycan-associated lipoprotein Pal [Deltaproteobacteria bacterium]|nr:peptidoglycan-associated lipoprotein Pal [Deltaproteobacteria bacterium]